MLKATGLVIEGVRIGTQTYLSSKPKVLTTAVYKGNCLYPAHESYQILLVQAEGQTAMRK